MLQIECTVLCHGGSIRHDKQIIWLFTVAYLLGEVLQSPAVQSSHSYTLCWRINLTGTGTGEGGTVADKVSIGSDGHY